MDTAVATRPPELPERSDAGRRLRAWWKGTALEILEGAERGDVDVARAMRDLSLLSAATLMADLANPKVSRAEKRKIALVMSPKLIATTRGRPRKDDARAPRELLDAYNLTAKTG